ncbi:unnamed protein product [Spirodela intermedia]|uniref:TH1 domain-containing protein n=1 Tax=Spirodela intermedia TaxID=51605 RepID=A0A7I8JWR9_SPIIN|nr:unnamed protein product [Spirodela intermedia]
MDRRKASTRIRVHAAEAVDVDRDAHGKPADDESEFNEHRQPSVEIAGDLEPFMGVKMRRLASIRRECRGDYLDVRSYSYLTKLLSKQGDKKVLFADKVLKFTESGKMKRRILLITDFAIYLVDPETESLKRRIVLSTVGKLCLSELNDNFFAIIVPREYDCLMATTRKTEIVTVLIEATKTMSEYELVVTFLNRFEYHAASDVVKEVHCEEVDGGVRTRILRKGGQ